MNGWMNRLMNWRMNWLLLLLYCSAVTSFKLPDHRGPAPAAEEDPDDGGTAAPDAAGSLSPREGGRVYQRSRPGGPWWLHNAGRSVPGSQVPPRKGGMWSPNPGSASPCVPRGSLNVPSAGRPIGPPHGGSGTLYPGEPHDKLPLCAHAQEVDP